VGEKMINPIKAIKFFFQAKGDISKIKEAKMKSGVKTTEFWVTVIGALVNVALFFYAGIDPKILALVITGLACVYTVARTIVKATVSKKDDEVFNRVLNALKPLLDKMGIGSEEIKE
jgi:uncharacterized membrane protein HdeD (DUF308 family)